MEELHAAASAYYSNGSPELQHLAWSFFLSMDTNNDGRISSSEFYEFLQQSGYSWIVNDPSLFMKLDRNRDGGLDFYEVLTFYYIVKTRNILCRGCGVCLCGLYFTCVACFDVTVEAGHHQVTYDLCAACYGVKKFYHHHTYFLDNHVLLRSKRGLPPCASPDLNQAMTPVPQPLVIYNSCYFQQAPGRNKWFQAYELFENAVVAVAAAGSVAAYCTIM